MLLDFGPGFYREAQGFRVFEKKWVTDTWLYELLVEEMGY